MDVKVEHYQLITAVCDAVCAVCPPMRRVFTWLWKLRHRVKPAMPRTRGNPDQHAELDDVERAKRLGFPICACAFPPGIMTLKADTYACPKCERTRPRPLTAGERNAAARERWERGDTWVQGGR